MRASPYVWTALATVSLLATPKAARAQDQAAAQAIRAEIDQVRQDFAARLAALEERLTAIAGTPSVAPAAASPAMPTSTPTADVPAGLAGSGSLGGSLPVYGNALASSKIFNPDIAVIGNFLGAAGKNTIRPGPSLALPESEASFQAVVDPYARADFFFSFGESGVGVEEGYLTFPALPGGLLMKVGKFRAAFGRVNTQHTHVVQWADRPLVTDNLIGGDEGLSDAGVSVARLVPNPWIFLEATGQVFRGDSGDVFRSSKRGDLSYVGRLRGYHDLGEATNVDLGVSYARGHNAAGYVSDIDVGRFMTDMFGIDATVRWRPLQRAIYRGFIGQSEVIWSRQERFTGTDRASGFYVSGDYQFARRWLTGVRVDRSGRAGDGSAADTGQSLTLTYRPSEFGQVRGQVRHTRYAEGVTANELLFQFQFSIGAHGAHPF